MSHNDPSLLPTMDPLVLSAVETVTLTPSEVYDKPPGEGKDSERQSTIYCIR